MMGLLKISALLSVLCLVSNNVQGAPTKGRYMWVRCRPNGNNANCETEKGPLIDLPGPAQRLPPSAAHEIAKTIPGSDPEELSGDFSGNSEPLANMEAQAEWIKDEPQLTPFSTEDGSTEPEEGSALDIDYSNFVVPKKVALEQDMPPKRELQEDNLML